MMKRYLVAAAVICLSLGSVCFGQEYKIDPSHSDVGFMARHLVVGRVFGQFRTFEGHFSFDPKKPKESRVEATIDVNSVDTRQEKRDAHLKSQDFFWAEKYPKMKFVSTKIVPAGKNKYKMTGDLTIRDKTRPVTFDVEYGGETKGMSGDQRVGFTATAKINRQDFDVKWNKTVDKGGLVVGDDVILQLNVEAAAM